MLNGTTLPSISSFKKLDHVKSWKNKYSHQGIKSTYSDPIKVVRIEVSSSPMTQSRVKVASFPTKTMVSEATSPKNLEISLEFLQAKKNMVE